MEDKNMLFEQREIIDMLDREMAALFVRRMEAVRRVAEYKLENGIPVFDPAREEQMIKKNSERISDDIRELYADFLRGVTCVSKRYQSEIIGARGGEIEVNIKGAPYKIVLGRGSLARAGEILRLDRKVLIVTDKGVPSEYANAIAAAAKEPTTVTLEGGEGCKSIVSFEMLCRTMQKNGFTRTDCVVAVGGGVVGDLAGFAASAYMRGIDFYNVPTTLLAQVDSSIGGKVAVNLDSVKNTVGAFYQPKCVLIDPNVLKTLPPRQISNGLAEALKMSLTSDRELFELFESGDANENIEKIIERSLMIKKKVVEEDEKESGVRKILNFGHTVGHGIESESFGKLYHGECVALGMLPMCSDAVRARLLPVLGKLGLPTEAEFDRERAVAAMLHDKKLSGDEITVTYVNEIGKYELKKLPTEEFLKKVRESFKK